MGGAFWRMKMGEKEVGRRILENENGGGRGKAAHFGERKWGRKRLGGAFWRAKTGEKEVGRRILENENGGGRGWAAHFGNLNQRLKTEN